MIRVEGLTKKFGPVTAVDNVSFEVRKGEVFAFLGPNGSGKTTTLKSIVGLNVPTCGRILVGGLDVQKSPKESRRLMSYLPQRIGFPDNLTAREILHFYADIRRVSHGRANELLALALFNGFSGRPVGEFSGGMVQRLGLAVVSLDESPVLLLDEPTANLDPQGVKRFRQFVLAQKACGRTVLFSTHLLAEAEQLADRIGIFVGGKLVSEESADTLQVAFRASRTIEDLYLHYVNEHEEH